MTELPLKGLKIISFEQYGSAPYATKFLADMGAEIIKIEPPGGDFARQTGPLTLGPDDSLYYQFFNLNKRSMVLDLRVEEDRALLHRMAAEADAVINNLRGSVPAKLGLDYAGLGKINPKIVCGHISAYGRTGSRVDWPGYDFLMQAEAGFMALTGEPGSPPTRVGLSMVDYMTGMMLAFAVASAIRGVERGGQGMDVDVSLFDAALHQLAYQGTWYLNEGIVTEQTHRSAHPTTTPVQLYRAADGWLYICCMNQRFWEVLVELVGRPDLAADPRFVDLDARYRNREILTQVLDDVFSQRSRVEWMEVLQGRIPAAPVETLEGAMDNPFIVESEMVQEVEHASGRRLKMLANPIRLGGRRIGQRSAPRLDADGPELRNLFSDEAQASNSVVSDRLPGSAAAGAAT